MSLPETLTSLGSYAFWACDNLPNITLPSSLTTIHGGTFFQCVGLSDVTLPKNLTTIETYAFKTCSSLRLLTLPDKITSVASDAFDSGLQLTCENGTLTDTTLTSAGISHGRTNHFYYTENTDGSCVITGYWGDSTEPIIPADLFGHTVVGIAREAFSNNTAITSITIPSTVKSIGYWAFDGCTNLQNVYAADVASWVAIDFDYE